MGKRECVNTIYYTSTTLCYKYTVLMYSSKIIAFNEKFVIKTRQIKSERIPGEVIILN